MKMKRTILILLGLMFSLFTVGTAKADPRVQYIIISDHADRGYSTHWRGKRLDTERYRAFSRDYYEPRLYGPSNRAHRHHDRCGHNDYYRSNRRHYDRDRTYIVVPDKRRYYRDRHSRHYHGDRHYRRNKHDRRYHRGNSQSGGRLVINF